MNVRGIAPLSCKNRRSTDKQPMNPAKATHIAAQAEEIEPTSRLVPDPLRGARSRRLLILGIALLAAWIAIVALSAIQEISADLEEIRARFALPSYSKT